MKRVVVTGMGLITPFGRGVQHNWQKIVESNSSSLSSLTFEGYDITSKVAGRVPRGTEHEHQFHDGLVPSQYRLGSSDFIKYAIVASEEALTDSKLDLASDESLQERTGVCIGSGVGAMEDITNTHDKVKAGGQNKASAYFVPRILINEASGIVSIINRIKGPNMSIVSACATGAHAIGESFRKIKYGEADVMLCGGSEASITPLSVIGFARMRALSTKFNDRPQQASRPFDEDRDGFVISEGAGVLVLEELEHALKRNATIYCEVAGYGATGDAHHLSSPEPSGNGAKRAMANALKEANITDPLAQVDYINAHATSTPMGDGIECQAVLNLFGATTPEQAARITMSSTKGAIGHLLGAAGSAESIVSIMALHNNMAPPNVNLERPTPESGGINLVVGRAQSKPIDCVLKNSFGFGGTNSSLVFKRYRR
ncbi:hypothetical protein SAMD00019534_051280 [Acytostelium subglobosum LB1]|uniref:hypothetical protein n=1 Tax=Acytostelium subglobosum LB1 TaxID=1410327 RepID=UPI000644AFA9|nr:hypothetical protein SAMD00019534_051280 [Acytostelium subglobosum LB1]GAM21953.1 hypothetical protein SAMD00019534_051280 [Acytostelium subglobosum LB1]|eukprot:XP_012755053.1 hypothetical protein SAMD00019534_051280 [Acytostelium subglobosum LB1]